MKDVNKKTTARPKKALPLSVVKNAVYLNLYRIY